MTMWKFFAIRAAALAVSLMVLGTLWFLVPALILWGFDLNLLWIDASWSWVSQLLPYEISIPADAIGRAHSAIAMLVQGMAAILPELTAWRVEAATRAALGEGWILVVQLALPLRIYWMRKWA